MKLTFRYVPLTFISSKEAIQEQLENSIIFKSILEKYNELRPLNELLSNTQYGYTASAKTEGNCKLLRITDINNGKVNWEAVPFCNCENPEKYALAKDDVLIARTGNNISYLVGNDVPDNVLFASYLIRLTCDTKKLLPSFLYRFLNSYIFWSQILKMQRGALLQNVNAKLMGQLLIPYCSVDVQKEILSDNETELNLKILGEKKIIKGIHNLNFSLNDELNDQLDLLKKLRQQILQDAVQGKLVPQDPNDEPASKLLERIKAEKEKLVREKNIKKEKPLPPIKPEEIPFEIPENWVWCRLGEICFKITDGFHNTPPKISKGVPYISATHVKSDKIDWQNCDYVAENYHRELFTKASPKKGELLVVNIGAGCGTPAIIDVDYEFSFKNTAILKFNQELISNNYLFYYLLLSRESIYNTLTQGGLQPFLSLKILNNIHFPMPPRAEQLRIVNKIEQLIKLCDELEQTIQQNQKHTQELLQVALKEALEPKN